jgi:drug/metabolite transporter (DMT)-like permease
MQHPGLLMFSSGRLIHLLFHLAAPPAAQFCKAMKLMQQLTLVVCAACCVLCSLSFYALRIMSAHTYTLLSDLKVITTCVLSYLLLDKALNRQAVSSLFLLFTGICIGQYATSTADETASALPVDASWWHGVALMAFVAVLSAVAAVYTEWVMNYSATYGQESLNLQNMRLYASGTLLNGLFCMLHTKTSLSTFDDMRASHWVCVVGLAFMGLVTVS